MVDAIVLAQLAVELAVLVILILFISCLNKVRPQDASKLRRTEVSTHQIFQIFSHAHTSEGMYLKITTEPVSWFDVWKL